MDVLVLTTSDDRAARRSASWAGVLAGTFPRLAACIVVRTREQAAPLLGEYRHIIYFGHGEVDRLVARRRPWQRRKTVIDERDLGPDSDRVMVAVACWSGEELGPAVAGANAVDPIACFLGWRDEVSWPAEWPDPIGTAVIDGLRVLLDGGSVEDCERVLVLAFKDAYRRYREEGTKKMATERVRIAKWCATAWWTQIAVEGSRSATL
jgi:hypothetical protein